MKAFVYALMSPEGCSWHLSVNLRIDREYWISRHGTRFRLQVLEPALSFGQAYALCERLRVVPADALRTGLAGIISDEAGKIGIAKNKIRQWRWRAWSPSQAAQQEAPAVNCTDLSSMQGSIDDIAEAIHGRFLLFEEFVSLLEHKGMIQTGEMAQAVWRLQMGLLSGQLRLEPGIALQGSAGPGLRAERGGQGHLELPPIANSWAVRLWRGVLGRRETASCHRCGTSGTRVGARRHGGDDNSGADGQVHLTGGRKGGRACEEGAKDGESGVLVKAGGLVWTQCADCGGLCPYCSECLTMGRVRFCTPFITAADGSNMASVQDVSGGAGKRRSELDAAQLEAVQERWGLSPVQAEASGAALCYLDERQPGLSRGRFLIWAVTGAGKTEMIFPLIEYCLDRGGRVAVTTPRRDVVLELKPRLEKAFPGVRTVTLYGGSQERWDHGQITIATTHQLMRFKEAFELVIIDEIDAFPYHNNPMLEHAAAQVCKQGGAYILLSATPPEKLQKDVKRGRLPHVKVPARYHRYPLPVPEHLLVPPVKVLCRGTSSGSTKLLGRLRHSVERGAQLFVFVPKIGLVDRTVNWLRRNLPSVTVEGTSSKDESRTDKVVRFRSAEIRVLVTTTILERGVTIPKSDVYILDADSELFDPAALIQMAGRAGRSAQDPQGLVCFASQEWNASQKDAIKQIKAMNRIARKKGYLNR